MLLQNPSAAVIWVIGQATVNIYGRVLAITLVAAMAAWIIKLRPPFRRVWPLMLLPVPWVLLALWTGLHWRAPEAAPTTSDGETLGVVVLALSLAWSGFAVLRARGFRWLASGLALINSWFCLIAGLTASMATAGIWL